MYKYIYDLFLKKIAIYLTKYLKALFFFFLASPHDFMGSSFLTRDWTPGPRQWYTGTCVIKQLS